MRHSGQVRDDSSDARITELAAVASRGLASTRESDPASHWRPKTGRRTSSSPPQGHAGRTSRYAFTTGESTVRHVRRTLRRHGSRLVRPLGYRPSRKNPTLCATCVELAPPGGITTEVGVLFADLRGFTARSESITPQEASALLRRLYTVAEEVLFPKAIIDKLIGDEVMALYLPIWSPRAPWSPETSTAARWPP